MSELRDRIRQTLEREDPPPGRLERTLARAHRRELTRRVTSAVVGLAMFGAVVAGVWIGTRPERNPIGERSPTATADPTAPSPVISPSSPLQGTSEISPVARIACEDGRTLAIDGAVDALPDGVHFSVENRTARPVFFGGTVPLHSPVVGGAFGDPIAIAPHTTNELVLPVPPAEATVRCTIESSSGPELFSAASVLVRDPRGHWIGTDPQCSTGGVVRSGDIAAEATVADPIDGARGLLHGVRETDTLERAAYLESDEQAAVRVVRGGAVVGNVVFASEVGRWSIIGFAVCADEGLSILGTAQGPPTLARVRCEEGRTVVLDREVAAQADGIHFLVENPRDEYVEFMEQFGLEPGETRELVYPAEPGLAVIHCYNIHLQSQPSDDEYAHIEVTDPEGYWMSPELDCPAEVRAIESVIRDGAEPSGGFQGAPEDAVRADGSYRHRIKPGDDLVPGGYPQGDDPTVLVVRDGATIATIAVLRTKDGGWLVMGHRACSGLF